MLCNNCQKYLGENYVRHQEQFFCPECYSSVIENKQKNKWYITLGISIFFLVLGIGLLLFWYFKK